MQDTVPSSADFQELIDRLLNKDSALAALNKEIPDALDSEEFDDEVVGAPDYHDKITIKAIRRLGSLINARTLDGFIVLETHHPMHAGASGGSSNAMGATRLDTTCHNITECSEPRAPGVLDIVPKLQALASSRQNRELLGSRKYCGATIYTYPNLTNVETLKAWI